MMLTIEEIGKIVFANKYWQGGCGGNYKAPYSNKKPKTFTDAIKSRYICGVIPENVILVDYDDPAAFECRLKMAKELKQHCVVIRSPNKGGHFFWYNNQKQPIKSNSGNKTVLTLHPVDYKCGIRLIESSGEIKAAKNCASLSKEDGSLREVLYAEFTAANELDEIPFYDLPLKSGVKHDFLNMSEGAGRQEGLFTYMNPIKAAGFEYEQFKEVVKLIEQFIFKVPLGNEFENAIRREAWDSIDITNNSKFYNQKGQFLHNKFGDYLINKYHVGLLNGYMYSYKEGVYVPGYVHIERNILKEIPILTRTKRNEVLDYIRIQMKDLHAASPLLIAFNNGLFNVEENSIIEFSPEYVVTNRIPWDYKPDARCDLIDTVLNRLSCNDLQIRALLEEVGGMCLYRDNTIGGGKAVILKGEKANGKSTFIALLQAMLGNDNVSNLDFRELDGKFSTAMLFGKLANLGDDISDSYKEDIALFKKVVTGEMIKAEEKGKPPFNFKPYVKLIFSANNIPRINDSTGAALRRLLIIPLNARFNETDSNYDPQIRYKLVKQEAIEYFIQLSIKGLQRVLTNKTFTLPAKVQVEKDNYEKENNPVLAFIEEYGKDNIVNEDTKKVFEKYTGFCIANNFKQMQRSTFTKRINQALDTETKRLRIRKALTYVFVEK